MSWDKTKVIEYVNYDELKRNSMEYDYIPNDLQDKITMNKDLFFSLLWNESARVAKELNKDVLEVTFADIINYLFGSNNLSDVVSVTRLYNINNNN